VFSFPEGLVAMTTWMRLIAPIISTHSLFNQTSTAMTTATTNEPTLARPAARKGSRKKRIAPVAGTVELVPVGDDGLDNNKYTKVPVEKVLKMIDDYRNGSSGQSNGEGNKAGDDGKVWSCWICLDAILRLFELDPDLENVIKHILKKGEVSGIRIHKGRSNGKENFVLTTTRELTEKGTYGAVITRQPDRLEPGNRVLYIDDTHTDPYGGSMCPPCNA
jgi:hypothetical protein